jgi:alpha-aminoadipate carrier protein LysW
MQIPVDPTLIQTTECPQCAGAVAAAPRLTGEILDCPDCGAELEVVRLTPLAVAVAPEVEEDWGE